MTNEQLARVVRETWVAYCVETGDTKPSHLTPYGDLSEWDKEADRRIAAVVAASATAQARDLLRAILTDLEMQWLDHDTVDRNARRIREELGLCQSGECENAALADPEAEGYCAECLEA